MTILALKLPHRFEFKVAAALISPEINAYLVITVLFIAAQQTLMYTLLSLQVFIL
jgi:hypothetical protein